MCQYINYFPLEYISVTLEFDSAAVFVYNSQRKSVYFCRTLMQRLTFNTHAAVHVSAMNMFLSPYYLNVI